MDPDKCSQIQNYNKEFICKNCKNSNICRPNVMMFHDMYFNTKRVDQQEINYENFIKNIDQKACIIEIGAGKKLPTLRNMSNELKNKFTNIKRIRIDPNECEECKEFIIIKESALSAISKLNN